METVDHPQLDYGCIVYGRAHYNSFALGKSSSNNDYDSH